MTDPSNKLSPTDFQIIAGDEWVRDAERLERGDAARWVGAYNDDVLAAPVDVVVGGRNLSADLRAEPVLAFAEAWVAAVERLAAGGERANVPFLESPMEIALERDCDRVLLSFFALGPPGTFRAERVRIDDAVFLGAVRGLLDALAASSTHLAAQVRSRVRAAVARMPAALPQGGRLDGNAETLVVHSRSSCGLELTTTLQPATSGLHRSIGALRFDRHLLLAHGHILMADHGGRSAILTGRPLRLLEAMVDVLGSVLGPHATNEGVMIPLTDLEGGRVELRVMNEQVARLAVVIDAHAQEFHANPDDIARLICDHTRAVTQRLLRTNAALSRNALFEELDGAAEALRTRLRVDEHRASGAGTAGPRFVPTPAATVEVGYAFPTRSIRKMRYERTWTAVLPGADPRSLCATTDGMFELRYARGVARLDGASGDVIGRVRSRADQSFFEVRQGVVLVDDEAMEFASLEDRHAWRTPWTAPVDVASASAAGEHVAVVERNGSVQAFHIGDGRRTWTSPSGFGGSGIAVAGAVIVSSHPGLLRGLDAATGEERWRVKVPRERIAFRAFGGVIAVVADDPLRSATWICTLRADTGDWIRKHELAADVRAVGWHRTAGVAVLVDGPDESHIVVTGIDRAREWGAPLPWRSRTQRPRIRLDADARGVVVSMGAQVARVSADGVMWSLERDAREDAGDRGLARFNASDGLEFVAGSTGIRVVETSSGRVLHLIQPFWEELGGVAADGRGNLAVIERIPNEQHRVHGVSAVGLIATLEGGKAAG